MNRPVKPGMLEPVALEPVALEPIALEADTAKVVIRENTRVEFQSVLIAPGTRVELQIDLSSPMTNAVLFISLDVPGANVVVEQLAVGQFVVESHELESHGLESHGLESHGEPRDDPLPATAFSHGRIVRATAGSRDPLSILLVNQDHRMIKVSASLVTTEHPGTYKITGEE